MNGSYPEKKARATKNISMPIQFPNYKMDQRTINKYKSFTYTPFIYKFNGFYSKLPLRNNEATVSAVLNYTRTILENFKISSTLKGFR